jgi:hypothetical protein
VASQNHISDSDFDHVGVGVRVDGYYSVIVNNRFSSPLINHRGVELTGGADATANRVLDNVFSCSAAGIVIVSGTGHITASGDHNNVCP